MSEDMKLVDGCLAETGPGWPIYTFPSAMIYYRMACFDSMLASLSTTPWVYYVCLRILISKPITRISIQRVRHGLLTRSS